MSPQSSKKTIEAPEKQPEVDKDSSLEQEQELKTLVKHRQKSRNWWKIWGAIALLGGLGFGGWWWWQEYNSSSETTTEQSQPRGTPVELGVAETTTVEETSEFVGNLEAEKTSSIESETEGRIEEIYVREGQQVAAGSAIARISAEQTQTEIERARSSVNAAQAAQETARAELQALIAERSSAQADVNLQQEQYRRISGLVGQGALARQELDRVTRDLEAARAALNATNQRIAAAQARFNEAQATLEQRQADVELLQEQLQDNTIVAPFAGVIGDIPVKEGEYLQSGDDLTSITANQDLDLRLAIPIERTADLRLGLTVEAEDSRGNYLGTGRISFIAPQVDTESQAIAAKATFPNPNGELRDGQFVRSRIIWEERPNAVVIPTTAIVYEGEERFVYLPVDREGQLIAQKQPIQLGLERETTTEVTEGLQPGTQIVISGMQKLFDGAPISPLGGD
ncbi:MAG: efflux RND transporter periplasmic adaptor subunit [Oscillatoria sp. PMC 1051.18]|nr:efflux RND transporter periplasmic adaptor subunit [Oscillatoria sp. PMC 1050.18]MEC5031110.1 efflux RND transporter periplasmic adaptor subunit [Oscillatoria sp. PMC 1051.18]